MAKPPPISEEEQDLEWVRAIIEGRDRENAFKRIHAKYRHRIESYFARKGFLPAEVPELAQDVFLLVFKNIATFEGKSSFRSWLFAIASNHSRDQRKSAGRIKRRGNETALDGHEIEGSIRSRDAGPDAILFEKERAAKLDAALETLPKRVRECARLRLQDYELKQIATLLRIKDGTVKAQLHQARRRLAVAIGDDHSLWENSS